MYIYKFLLIDAVLLIAILILFILQGGKRKYQLLKSSSKEKVLSKTSFKLPEKEKLLELEKFAKNQGSGIKFDSLVGDWKFISVGKKAIDEEDLVFSSLLKIFAAKIKFKKIETTGYSPKYSVIASIQLGVLTMEFSGSGYLKGEQPLLTYFLNLIELKAGSKLILRRSLKEQNDKEKSFFSLIALEKNDQWLSARGQGGELVTWLKD